MKSTVRIITYLKKLQEQETPEIYWGSKHEEDGSTDCHCFNEYTRGRLRGRIEALEYVFSDELECTPIDIYGQLEVT